MRRGLRQRDVSALAGISQATVSLVERGHLAGLTVETIRAVARALDVWLPFEPRWRGAELPRLMDERHADLVGRVVGELKRLGWEIRVEYSFNSWGERGSVDVLGLAPARRALLVVEVKTQVVDVQELLSKLDRKRRVAPAIVSADLGWRPAVVGSLLVLPEETRARAAVARHAAVFEAALPSRNAAVKRWLALPSGPLAGVWFLRYSSPSSGKRAGGGATRVRRPSQAQLRASPRSRAGGPAPDRPVVSQVAGPPVT